MDQALESYDVCISLLQSKEKSPPEGNPYTITLPNLRTDAVISAEEVGGGVVKKTSPNNLMQL